MAFTFIQAFRYSKRIHLCSNSLETAQIVLNITPCSYYRTVVTSIPTEIRSLVQIASLLRAEQYPRVAFACWLGLRLLIRSCKRAPSAANWSRDTDSNSRR